MDDEQENQQESEQEDEVTFKKSNIHKHFGKGVKCEKQFLSVNTSLNRNKFRLSQIVGEGLSKYTINYKITKESKVDLKFDNKFKTNLNITHTFEKVKIKANVDENLKPNLKLFYSKSFKNMKLNLINELKLTGEQSHNLQARLSYKFNFKNFYNEVVLKSKNFSLPEIQLYSKFQTIFDTVLFTEFSFPKDSFFPRTKIQAQNQYFTASYQKNKNHLFMIYKNWYGISWQSNNKNTWDIQLTLRKKLSKKTFFAANLTQKYFGIKVTTQIQQFIKLNLSFYNQYNSLIFRKVNNNYPFSIYAKINC